MEILLAVLVAVGFGLYESCDSETKHKHER